MCCSSKRQLRDAVPRRAGCSSSSRKQRRRVRNLPVRQNWQIVAAVWRSVNIHFAFIIHVKHSPRQEHTPSSLMTMDDKKRRVRAMEASISTKTRLPHETPHTFPFPFRAPSSQHRRLPGYVRCSQHGPCLPHRTHAHSPPPQTPIPLSNRHKSLLTTHPRRLEEHMPRSTPVTYAKRLSPRHRRASS